MKKSSNPINEEFISSNANEIQQNDVDKILKNEENIKKKSIQLGLFKLKIKTLFQMLKDYKSKKYTETPWKSIAAIIFALLYVLNPLDLAPDFIPIIGYIDDATVLAFTFKLIENDIERYEMWQKNKMQCAEG